MCMEWCVFFPLIWGKKVLIVFKNLTLFFVQTLVIHRGFSNEFHFVLPIYVYGVVKSL